MVGDTTNTTQHNTTHNTSTQWAATGGAKVGGEEGTKEGVEEGGEEAMYTRVGMKVLIRGKWHESYKWRKVKRLMRRLRMRGAQGGC